MESCKHSNFRAAVEVHRIESDIDESVKYMAEIKIDCKDCDTPMVFTAVDQTTLTARIHPDE